MKDPVRLQKYLSQCGIASRRKAEELITLGRVKVDGLVVTEMGRKSFPAKMSSFATAEPLPVRPACSIFFLTNQKVM